MGLQGNPAEVPDAPSCLFDMQWCSRKMQEGCKATARADAAVQVRSLFSMLTFLCANIAGIYTFLVSLSISRDHLQFMGASFPAERMLAPGFAFVLGSKDPASGAGGLGSEVHRVWSLQVLSSWSPDVTSAQATMAPGASLPWEACGRLCD